MHFVKKNNNYINYVKMELVCKFIFKVEVILKLICVVCFKTLKDSIIWLWTRY